jgi:nickel-dependent lactate racemase
MNADLRQGMKCIGNVEPAVKEGGLVLALLACRNGIGDIAMPPKALSNKWLRRILRFIGPKRVLGFVDKVKKGAGVEERFMAHFSMQVARKLQLVVWSPGLPADTGTRMGLFVQVGSPEQLLEVAKRFAPPNATVHVFPHGGVTYPAPRDPTGGTP